MTTLSLIKDMKEVEDLKIKLLPIESQKRFHKDYNWLREEYSEWSKQFEGYNSRVDDILLFYVGLLFNTCNSKEMLITIMKASDICFYIDKYLIPAREKRSSELAQKQIKKLLKTLKTGNCDENFIPGNKIIIYNNFNHENKIGKRLIESLTPLKIKSTDEQWAIAVMILEQSLQAHLDIHCNYWMKNQFIPLKDYAYKRAQESFHHLSVFLSELCVDSTLSHDIRYNHLVQTFSGKIAELILAVDDYYMGKTKLMHNDITSRIICFLNEKGCNLQEAFDNQFKYAMDLYKECNDLRDKINADREIASDKLSDWMNTAFNIVHTIFTTVAYAQGLQVNDDQTLRSVKWDQVYNDLVSKTHTSSDPWDIA